MTPAQCRAARELLGWDEDRLASLAALNVGTVRDFEAERLVNGDVTNTLTLALERAGVEFLDEGASGVRRVPEPRSLGVDQLNASNDD
jgi:hypothetical protein